MKVSKTWEASAKKSQNQKYEGEDMQILNPKKLYRIPETIKNVGNEVYISKLDSIKM